MLTSAQMGTVKSALQTSYESSGGTVGITIPWEQLIAVLQMLASCFPTPTPALLKTAIADDGQRDRLVRMSMIEVMGLGSFRRCNGHAVSAAFKTVVPTLDDTILAAAID